MDRLFLFFNLIERSVGMSKIIGEIRIRNVDAGAGAGAVARIDQLAKKKGQTRNSFLRNYIETLAIQGQLKANDDKYANLVKNIGDIVSRNTDEMVQLRTLIDTILSGGNK